MSEEGPGDRNVPLLCSLLECRVCLFQDRWMVLAPSRLALCMVATCFGSSERLFGHWINKKYAKVEIERFYSKQEMAIVVQRFYNGIL